MKKLLLPLLASVFCFLGSAAEKENQMNTKSLELTNCRVITGMDWKTVPSDRLFAEKGKEIVLGEGLWDLEKYSGKQVDKTKCIMIRGEVMVPKTGKYLLGAGADWWFKVGFDGKNVMDDTGPWPLPYMNHWAILNLTAGKHIVDIHFSRGRASACMCFSLKPVPYESDAIADLNKSTGRIRKELHGSNTTLILSSRALNKYDEALRKLNFTFSRTHDWALWNGGQRIIDTHFIFPLMHLDPKDPANYYFDATDEIIRLTQEEAGMEVFYRLGTSIEHTGEKHFNVIPPKDYEKYAEVLAGIVRHYTRGWANGHHYKIRYWEIWNEPDGRKNMWDAPYETFIPFFVTVLKRLKSEFPELQFGGPALCSLKLPLFKPLLEACKAAGVAPDFISWHCYGSSPGALINQPSIARNFLDEMGFKKTKLCINEWHYIESWQGVQSANSSESYRKATLEGPTCLQSTNSGVYNLAVLIGWQDSPLDLAMWYGSSWDSPKWGYRSVFREYTKNYYSMELFGRFLREYPVRCQAESIHYILAGRSEDGSKAGILLADYKGSSETIEILAAGLSAYNKISAVVLDDDRNNEPVPVTVTGEKILLKKKKPGSAAFLIQLQK